jgi:glycosyltransferase involved in cell wall biosynthesis
MKVAFLTLSISRAGGGVSDSMRQLGRKLHQADGVTVEALGISDPDAGRDIAAWAPLIARAFPSRSVVGFARSAEMERCLYELQPDIVHTHGLWSFASVIANRWSRRVARPEVVSPHGMLDPWALQNSAWTKRIAAVLFERRHLRGAACLHALCAAEAQAMRHYGLSNPICVIPNGVDLPPETGSGKIPAAPWAPSVRSDQRVLLYLGRLHPKKGLANLLRAWAALRQEGRAGDGDWTLVIAGWSQGGHREELEKLAAELSLGDCVQFAGPLFDEAKSAAFHRADAFVLPSLSEGLPLVVLEAWAHGLPVLMTPACNLPEGFAARAAIGAEPDPRSLAAALRVLFDASDADRREMGARGRALVEKRFTWTRAAQEMLAVYQWVLGVAPRPDNLLV